ncbi:hypothetical protein COY62_02095 [bacterium (Candidatus Howlettbacteria) CG_4_10_14_0_8_um_filter_40_9]|nr:MAG: hypothetical protein COY62_02095 [bacterium (Candidatus Howlettbacteria) CG_4_10_14_0_8_um_filter_40_9]
MFNALLSSFSNETEVILDKTIMSKDKVKFISFMSLCMFFVFLITTSLFPIFGQVDMRAFTPKYLLSFGAVILIAFLYNYLYYYSLSHEDVTEVEPLAMTHSIIAVVLATLIYPSERDYLVFMLAIIAATALFISRIEKKHISFDKYALAMLGFATLFAVETLFLKGLLAVYSPVALYCFRTGMLVLLFFIFFRPKIRDLRVRKIKSIFLDAMSVSLQYVTLYFAYSRIGIVRTSLIVTLGPFLIFVFSFIFLKEKIVVKKLLADAVILACVVASVFV